jgi:hypothetical protein
MACSHHPGRGTGSDSRGAEDRIRTKTEDVTLWNQRQANRFVRQLGLNSRWLPGSREIAYIRRG